MCNGPFHRSFLDGYFPTTLLRYLDTSPLSQPGFKVDVKDAHVYIDSWFAGTLNIEVDFSERRSGF